jgi:hypothetical protein
VATRFVPVLNAEVGSRGRHGSTDSAGIMNPELGGMSGAGVALGWLFLALGEDLARQWIRPRRRSHDLRVLLPLVEPSAHLSTFPLRP